MKIISHVILGLVYFEEMPSRIEEQWTDGLKTNAERMNQKRRHQISDQVAFQHKVADVSAKNYGQMLDPNFKSRAGLDKKAIVIKQQVNLRESFQKYHDKLEYMFATVEGEPARRFKERVDKMKHHYAVGALQKLLAFSGTKVEGRGPAAVAGLWLTNDPTCEGQISGKDQLLEGGPVLITKDEVKASFKAAVTGRLIQAGSAIVRAKFDPGVIKQQNDITNGVVNAFVDKDLNLVSFATGGASRVDYIHSEETTLVLEIQVSLP